MKTQQSLQSMIPQLLAHIDVNFQNQIIYNRKLLDIYQGGLLKYVEESLAKELSQRAYLRVKERIAPINVLTKIVDKLSRVYSEPVLRDAGQNEIDKKLLSYYETQLDVDNNLQSANELLNLNKNFAIEPYLDNDGKPAMRILPADKFLVYSDSPIDPNAMTVFIKFMGVMQKDAPVVDTNGAKTQNANNAVKEVDHFYVYSDDEFMIIDADGVIHEYQPNPFGCIPFVYGKSSPYALLPIPDADNFAMAILIPKLLTNLNWAVQMCSHSIMYGIDIELPKNPDMSPDAFWTINSVVDAHGKSNPSVGVFEPKVDSDKVIALINSQMAMWLDSKGLKTGSVGVATVQNAASGVSKLIDEADSSATHRKQTALFRKIEYALWDLISKMHNFWVATQQLKDQSQAFSMQFNPTIKFGEAKVVVDTKTVLEELKIQFELGLITVKQALQKLNPDLDEKMIDDLLVELEAEAEKSKTKPADKLINSYEQQPKPDEQAVETNGQVK